VTVETSEAPTCQPSVSPLPASTSGGHIGYVPSSPSASPAFQPSTILGEWTRNNASIDRPAAPTKRPSIGPLTTGNYMTTGKHTSSWMGGESASRTHHHLGTSSCALLPTHSTCFVSTFPRGKTTRHTPNLLSAAFLPNGVATHKQRPSGALLMKATGRDGDVGVTNQLSNEPEPSPGGNNGGRPQLIPILLYSWVPFIPSIVLSTLNDDYQAMKAQFNSASAALPANIAKDSVEYLSVSSMYGETMQQLFVLLLSKRVALYFLATAATTYAGWRASMSVAAIRDGSVGGPGDALDRLNREVLEGEVFLAIDSSSSEESKTDEEDEDDSDLFATLVDRNPRSSNAGNVLALALPLVLAASLGVSYLAITFSGTPGDEDYPATMLPEMLTSSLPYLTSLPSAALCLFFAAADFRWALPERSTSDESTTTDDSSSSKLLYAGNILALAYVAGAYFAKIHPTLSLGEMKLDLWPLQNGVNIALATAVSRALSPFFLPTSSSSSTDQSSSARKSIRTVALALVGLTLFDAIFTFGTVANAAAAAVDATESSMSVMETVARSRLADSSSSQDVISPLAYLWQPGLLEIILGHDNSRATEALGVGDVVFPSILVAWAFAADNVGATSPVGADVVVVDDDAYDADIDASPSKSGGYPYATASVVGYIVGSFATEIVGSFRLLGNVSGLPALVFLVPSMLSAVTTMAWSRNELGDVWGAAPGDDDDDGGGVAGE